VTLLDATERRADEMVPERLLRGGGAKVAVKAAGAGAEGGAEGSAEGGAEGGAEGAEAVAEARTEEGDAQWLVQFAKTEVARRKAEKRKARQAAVQAQMA